MVSHSRVLPALLFSLVQLSNFWLQVWFLPSLPSFLPSYHVRVLCGMERHTDARAQLTFLRAEVELHFCLTSHSLGPLRAI